MYMFACIYHTLVYFKRLRRIKFSLVYQFLYKTKWYQDLKT